MTARAETHNRELISHILTGLRGTANLGEAGEAFVELLFARAIAEDLSQYKPEDLGQLALGAWGRFQRHRAGSHQIHISNPDAQIYSEYGAPTALTSIEIVNDNMPFLFDSVLGEISDRGLSVHLVLHPIVAVSRDGDGARQGGVFDGALNPDLAGQQRESVIIIHVDRIDSDTDRAALAAALDQVLQAVRLTVGDWQPMRARLKAAIDSFQANPPPIPVDEIAEAVHFLKWLADNNFTLIGMRQYSYDGSADDQALVRLEGSGLGILRDPDVKVLRRGRELVTFTPEIREFLRQPVPLIVTKANVRSLVHRRAHLDYVGVKLFSANGELEGELRIVGLFTSTAYTKSASSIPYLRRKVDNVVRRAGFDPESHSGKALINVLETYPRDELFQIDQDLLTDFALAIMQLSEHPRLRVLSRVDKFDRFASVLVFVPRDRFATEVRTKIGEYLAQVYGGRVSAFYPAFLEGALVRVHYIIGRYEGETPVIERGRLEADVAELVRSWQDSIRAAIARDMDPQQVHRLQLKYENAFSPAYQNVFGIDAAVHDVRIIERLSDADRLAVSFLRRDGDKSDQVALRLYNLGAPITLSDRVPILENMGFRVIDERTYSVMPEGGEAVFLHDMVISSSEGSDVDLTRLEPLLESCFKAVWRNDAEDDGYNGLVLRAGLHWRDVAVLRAYSRYLRQIRIPYSQDYMWNTLNRHPGIAADLVAMFRARFDPDQDLGDEARQDAVAAVSARIETALQAVDSLDEDRIIRRFMNLIMATMRCNVFQRDPHGDAKPAMAFKLASKQVDAMPAPRPYAEISVYSPRVEGVHLRFGKVARGGLRWSDRPQDFRTEVLGLVKAQQVKNAVIVPVGAKGGFVPKHLPVGGSRDDIQTEGIAAYKIFISSLLDVTDNLSAADLIPPRRVVRHDDDDPYLVVAADKGTATFSDIANSISLAREFWLGDAFASGGSAGYDHKKMAITARGGWEAVKRHFREMDIDIQTTPFSVVGVGDMSGDVFGNGMLLSRKIRLLAAFDHRDIFIDPDPDPEVSFTERERLFNLPRSSWADYDKKLISAGGGIFSRREKSIPLSPQIKALTGLSADKATPFELMSAILKADADLLWFGGIGTYVRAKDESDDQVGDRANDAIRVRAKDLRVKVVGEGANLGMTQRARIEFAQRGGRINNDAIDNSAGVNSSDLEVNIKIALGQVVRDGALSIEDRNVLLADMTEEVASLVLRNNYLQTLSLSLSEQRGLADLSFQARFMRDLEARGLLDRAVEDLPDDVALLEREKNGAPLTRPELAVLLAYAKITLFDQLLASDVPDDEYLSKELMRYFPAQLRERYSDAIAVHRLRREIIATMLANSMINRGGPTLIVRLVDQTGADVGRIASAFAAVRDSFSMTELNTAIDELDNKVSGTLQLDLYRRIQDLVVEQIAWFLRNVSFDGGLADVIARYKAGIETLFAALDDVLPKDALRRFAANRDNLTGQGIPANLAARMAALNILAMAPDIVLVADTSKRDVADVARAFFAISAYLETDRLNNAARELPLSDYFDRLALNGTLENLADAQRRMTVQVLSNGKSGAEALAQWASGHIGEVERTRKALKEIAGDGTLTLSKLMVGAGLLRDLVRR